MARLWDALYCNNRDWDGVFHLVTALLQITPGYVRGSIVAYYYLAITLLGGPVSPLLVGWLSTSVFGEGKLNLAMATQPALYGIPTLLLIPLTYKLYRRELAAREKTEAAA